MKINCASFLLLFMSFSCYCQVPAMLSGIWQNNERYVLFDTEYKKNEKPVPDVVLRTFYQWYNDRAAESDDYSKKEKRDRNVAETRVAEEMELTFVPLTDELYTQEYNKSVVQDDGDILVADKENSGAWDIIVKYAGHKLGGEDTYHIPVAVIGNDLYLNFALKVEDSDSVPASVVMNGTTLQAENLYDGYWKDTGCSNGILVCPPVSAKELLSYLVVGDGFYPIRYWRVDAEYDSSATAHFSSDGMTYYVPKHIFSANNTYSCTLGRRTEIRNMKTKSPMPKDAKLNSVLVQKHTKDVSGNDVVYTVRTATIMVFGKPYLSLIEGTRSIEDIVGENNKRRHPEPAPMFPPHGILDFDWSIVQDPPATFDRRNLDLGK